MLLEEVNQAEGGRNEKAIYANFHNGRVDVRFPDGTAKVYAAISGNIEGIYQATRTFRGNEKPYVYVTLTDGEEVYKLGFYADGGTYAGFLMSLYGKGIRKGEYLRLVPVLRGEYTNILVYRGEGSKEALKWDKSVELPTDRAAKATFLADLTREVGATLKPSASAPQQKGSVIYPV